MLSHSFVRSSSRHLFVSFVHSAFCFLFACLFVSEWLFLLFVSLFVVLFLLFSVCVCFCLFVFFLAGFRFLLFELSVLFCCFNCCFFVVCLFKSLFGSSSLYKNKTKQIFFSTEVILLYGEYVNFLFSKVYSCFFLFFCLSAFKVFLLSFLIIKTKAQ